MQRAMYYEIAVFGLTFLLVVLLPNISADELKRHAGPI